jgi:MFS family permease
MSIQATTSDAAPGAEPSAAGRKLGVALLVIASAQLMLTLDATIVNVALPSMERSLHLPISHLNWVATFYALSFGGLLLAGARAGDLYGRLRLFRAGLVVFAMASMAGGLAPNGTMLRRPRVRSALAGADWDGDGRCSRGWRGDLEGDAGRPGDDDAAGEAGEAGPAHGQPYLAPRSRDEGLA